MCREITPFGKMQGKFESEQGCRGDKRDTYLIKTPPCYPPSPVHCSLITKEEMPNSLTEDSIRRELKGAEPLPYSGAVLCMETWENKVANSAYQPDIVEGAETCLLPNLGIHDPQKGYSISFGCPSRRESIIQSLLAGVGRTHGTQKEKPIKFLKVE